MLESIWEAVLARAGIYFGALGFQKVIKMSSTIDAKIGIEKLGSERAWLRTNGFPPEEPKFPQTVRTKMFHTSGTFFRKSKEVFLKYHHTYTENDT